MRRNEEERRAWQTNCVVGTVSGIVFKCFQAQRSWPRIGLEVYFRVGTPLDHVRFDEVVFTVADMEEVEWKVTCAYLYVFS